jgi:hypothetical protein
LTHSTVNPSQTASKGWASIQRRPSDIDADLKRRNERIGQLIASLELAVEAERERLRRDGTLDPWFSLLEASVACIVSDQPEYVAQLYEEARHFAPVDSERSMYRALEVYEKLAIKGRNADRAPAKNPADSAHVSNFRLSGKARQMGVGAREFLRFAKLSGCDH